MPSEETSDPVERSSDACDDVDLYEVATWEERSRLDGFAVAVYRLLSASARWIVILGGSLLLIGIGGFSAVTDPAVGILTALSALPAFGLAAYVYRSDVSREPATLLFGTFLLSVITATFAAVLNGATQGLFAQFGFLGLVAFFFLFVGPVEETVKLLAVRLYAYRDERFDAVLDGAVYGAAAGLGFAFIENALYIERGLMGSELGAGLAVFGAGAQITATRALAGPGHVIYSAFAGYYLGLAKFNPDNRGPIVVKGLLIAAVIHAIYNSTVGIGSTVFEVLGLPPLVATFAYILLYDGLFGALLLRKLGRYRRVYRAVDADRPARDGDPVAAPTGPSTVDESVPVDYDAQSSDTAGPNSDTESSADEGSSPNTESPANEDAPPETGSSPDAGPTTNGTGHRDDDHDTRPGASTTTRRSDHPTVPDGDGDDAATRSRADGREPTGGDDESGPTGGDDESNSTNDDDERTDTP